MPTRARKFSDRWPRPKPPPSAKRRRTNRFYNTKAWRETRRDVLERHLGCEQCARLGLLTPATEVDHIVPLSRGGDPYALDNLQALCRPCHSRKTRRDNINHGARTNPQAA